MNDRRLYSSAGPHKHHRPSPTGISSFVSSDDGGVVSVDPRVLSVEPRGSWE